MKSLTKYLTLAAILATTQNAVALSTEDTVLGAPPPSDRRRPTPKEPSTPDDREPVGNVTFEL